MSPGYVMEKKRLKSTMHAIEKSFQSGLMSIVEFHQHGTVCDVSYISCSESIINEMVDYIKLCALFCPSTEL